MTFFIVGGDGEIAFDDFLVLAGNFGTPHASYTEGNIDLRNGVDFPDFLALASNFGRTPSNIATVPEPAHPLVYVLVASIALIHRHRDMESKLTPG